MSQQSLGFLLWGVLAAWALLGSVVKRVSRNAHQSAPGKIIRRATPRPRAKTGPAWEQDAPYPECFDDLDGGEL